MDLQHFGDCYDIVKRALLGWLTPGESWSAHPMFTAEVSTEDADEFARFLGVRLVSRERLTSATDREAYFDVGHGGGHLFFDPDTGVRLHRSGARHPKYLYDHELKSIAEARPNHLTMTFDQSLSRARDPGAQVREKPKRLKLPGFAYVSHVAFIVVGCDRRLVARARRRLLDHVGLPPDRVVSFGLAERGVKR